MSFRRAIFTRTTLHQTWSDLVLCSHMHNLCVISTMSTGEISGDISWLHPSATNQVNGPIDHKCNKDLKELLKELLFRVTSFRKQLSSVGPKIQNTHVTSPKTSMLIKKKGSLLSLKGGSSRQSNSDSIVSPKIQNAPSVLEWKPFHHLNIKGSSSV